jgi:hypothetical protein
MSLCIYVPSIVAAPFVLRRCRVLARQGAAQQAD